MLLSLINCKVQIGMLSDYGSAGYFEANVQILQYLKEALREFSAGLTGGCLDSDHGQL